MEDKNHFLGALTTNCQSQKKLERILVTQKIEARRRFFFQKSHFEIIEKFFNENLEIPNVQIFERHRTCGWFSVRK